MSEAQMIARAWLDDDYRASLSAQGVVIPPRPTDLSDHELDTCATAGDRPEAVFMSQTASMPCTCL